MLQDKQLSLLIATGMTITELGDDIVIADLVERQGIKPPEARKCFLCKRRDGEESIVVPNDYQYDEGEVQIHRIELKLYEVEREGGVTLGYWLCDECAVLLGTLGSKHPEPE